MKLIAAFVSISCLIACSKGQVTSNRSSQDATTSEPEVTLTETPEDVALAAWKKDGSMITPSASILTDYAANEVAADDQYKGKHLVVLGYVSVIGKDFTDAVVLQLGDDPFKHVSASLLTSEKSTASKLVKGKVAILICKGAGMVMLTPQLTHCVIGHKSTSDAVAQVQASKTNRADAATPLSHAPASKPAAPAQAQSSGCTCRDGSAGCCGRGCCSRHGGVR